MDAMECLRTRRSVRAFRPGEVSRETLETILDAGRLAPTARNVQPWSFVVVTDGERLERLAALTDSGRFIAQASACIAVLADRGAKYRLEDGSAATAQLLLAAHACGLGACWVAGDKKGYAEAVREFLGAPESVSLVSLVAVGHPAGPSSGGPPKKPLSALVHWEGW